MEDAVICMPYFPTRCQSLFAVLDGHNGKECSERASKHWPQLFAQDLGANEDQQSICTALHNSIITFDKQFLQQTDIYTDAGSTLVSVFYNDGVLYCANVGDSRAVLCRKDGLALNLSVDHKADRPDEQERMESVGGFVRRGRALGVLSVSRALGNNDLKQQVEGAVIASPEIQTVQLEQDDEFILIACDGLYDVMSSQESVDFIRNTMSRLDKSISSLHKRLQVACTALVNHAITVRFSTDNISIILVGFHNGSDAEQMPFSSQKQHQQNKTNDDGGGLVLSREASFPIAKNALPPVVKVALLPVVAFFLVFLGVFAGKSIH
jgi:serine/threonine protein phosphatase PrpC